MKKNLLKIGVLVAVSAPLAVNLTSCGGGSNSDSSSVYSVIDNTYDCKTEAAKRPGLIVVNFWHAFNNVNETAARLVNNAFNKAQLEDPNNANPICVDMSSYGDYDSLMQQVTAAATGDGVPTLVSSYPDHIATYNTQGIVVDMAKFQNDDSLKITDFDDFLESYKRESYNYVFTPEVYDSFVESETTNPYGIGQLLSLPVNKSTEVMYYNKTFFDLFTSKAAGDLSKVKLANGQDGTTAPYADLYQQALDAPTSTISVTYDGKTYTGKPWDLKADDDSVITLKHPGDVDPSKPNTWLTWDDVEVNGLIIQQISKNFIDPISGNVYNEIIQTGDKYASDITKRGSYSISWDSVSNLFITLANSLNKYSTVTKTADGTKMQAQLLFNDPEVVNLYQKMRDLFDDGIFTIPGLIGDQSSKYGTNAFVSQSIFMSVGSTAGAALNSAGEFEVGISAVPVVDNTTEYEEDGETVKTTKAKVISQGTNISMLAPKAYSSVTSASTDVAQQAAYKKQVAAWEYVKYVTSYEGNLTFATNTTYFPTRSSVLNSQEYRDHLDKKLAIASSAAEAKAMEVGLAMSTTTAMFTDRPFPGSAQIRLDIDPIFKTLLSSSTPVDQTIGSFYNEQSKKLSEF